MTDTPSTFGAGRYLLSQKIGHGGVGSVYLATQEPLGRRVALKLLHPELATDAATRRRFVREARAVASLAHPNIATVFDFGVEEDGTLYLAMEYIQGRTLTQAMREGLTPRHLLALLDPVLSALAHAHAQGVIHRDLKPDNILISAPLGGDRLPSPEELAQSPQLVKLVDFGIATIRGLDSAQAVEHTDQGRVVGTPLYMSPEQVRGERALTPASDLYSLGVILFEGLTGQHPFVEGDPEEGAMDIMIRHATAPPPSLMPPEGVFVPEGLRAVVARLLKKKQGERFSAAAQLRAALAEQRELLRRRAQVQQSSAALPIAPRPARLASSAQLNGSRFPYLSSPDVEARQGRQVRAEIPLVARAEERAALQAAVARCLVEERGQVILLEGEAGVGKTRLANWLKEKVAEAGQMRVAVGVFLREGGGGMSGLREIMEHLLAARGLDREALRERAAEALGWDSHQSQDLEALLAFLRPQREQAHTASVQPGALTALLLRTLEALSRSRPLLLLLDDIQWAGPELPEFLEYLAVEFRYRASRLMVVCTARREELGMAPALARGLRRLSRYEGETALRLALERLDDDASQELLDLLLPVESSLREELAHRAGGNPLHLVQLVQYLYQREALIWDEQEQRFSRAPQAEDLQQVPPSLTDLLLLRLEQIEKLYEGQGRLVALLERAAVLGERFAFEVLERMVEQEGNAPLADFLERGVDILLEEALLAEVKGRSEDVLRFHHGMTREAILQTMEGSRRRKRLHKLAGRALESLAPRVDAVAVDLAHHALQAGEGERAVEFLHRAGRAAEASNNPREAIAHYARCARLVAQVRSPQDDLRLTMARRIANLLEGFGAFAAAEQVCAAVLRTALFVSPHPEPLLLELEEAEHVEPLTMPQRQLLLETLRRSPQRKALSASAREDVTRATLGMGRQARFQGHQQMAEQILREGLALAQEAQQSDWITFAWIQLGWCAWDRADYDTAELLGGKALDAAQQSSDDYNRADALHLLADVARLQGDPGTSAELMTRAREAFQILGDRRRVAACLRDLAQLARARQDLEHAARLFTDARREFEALGDRHAVAMCLNGLGEVARFLGRLEVAQGCYQKAFETLHSLGARADAAIALTNLGQTALMAHNLELAQSYLRRAQTFAASRQHPYLTLGLHLNTALLRARQGHWPQAREHIAAGLEQSDQHQISDPDYARPLEELADLLEAEQGDVALARELRQRAARMWSALGKT